jgi:membrane peptidoglycan carboxypeptidase
MSTRRTDQLTFGTVISHLGVIVAVSAVMGLLVAGLAVPFAAALGVGAHSAAKSMKNLPEELQADPLAQRTRVLGRGGQVIATFYDQNRVNVKLSDVAPVMRTAIVAIEDNRFYEHGAIDVKGTIRAFLTNQANDGVTQGGSSITQQMAKMTLLAQAKTKAERKAATADTYQRKILELRHAIAFEQHYSKDWILERYLNIAYFGDGAYGIQSAARHYFNKDAKDLNLNESALLAGLVKNPTGYDPTTYPDRARARRDVVLDRMAQLNKITPAQASQAEHGGLALKVSPTTNGCLGSKAAFFCDYVHQYLLADPSLGKTVADREELLNNGGLTIKTTIDMAYQKAADKAVAAHVSPTDQAIGALAEVQPGTGNVMALAQSRPMGRDKKKGQTFLNYVVNQKYGDSAGFQGGSTFKLFTMAAALEMGIPASTTFYSPATIHLDDDQFQDCNGPYQGSGGWDPHNSTSNGTFNMYQGAQLSVNTYFAQLEAETGICNPYKMAQSMGVELTQPGPNKNGFGAERVPSFTLGVPSVSPLEMAGAYATVAARGLHCNNRPVTQILNSDGQIFKNYPKTCDQVMAQNSADTINDILRGVMVGGGFGAALALDKPSAGKTGTTQDNYSVWFDGYTPALATASMIAGANPQGTPISLNGQVLAGQYVPSAHGSTTAGPMWAEAMRPIQDLLPNEDFVAPSGLVAKVDPSVQLNMPDVTGMSVADASDALKALGLIPSVGTAISSSTQSGVVAATSPSPGSTTYKGSIVYIYPSRGSRQISAPVVRHNPPRNNGHRHGHGGGHGR